MDPRNLLKRFLAMEGIDADTAENGYAAERINRAKGDTARFDAMRAEYASDKETTAMRLYIETMEEILSSDDGSTVVIDRNLDSFLPFREIGGRS